MYVTNLLTIGHWPVVTAEISALSTAQLVLLKSPRNVCVIGYVADALQPS